MNALAASTAAGWSLEYSLLARPLQLAQGEYLMKQSMSLFLQLAVVELCCWNSSLLLLGTLRTSPSLSSPTVTTTLEMLSLVKVGSRETKNRRQLHQEHNNNAHTIFHHQQHTNRQVDIHDIVHVRSCVPYHTCTSNCKCVQCRYGVQKWITNRHLHVELQYTT